MVSAELGSGVFAGAALGEIGDGASDAGADGSTEAGAEGSAEGSADGPVEGSGVTSAPLGSTDGDGVGGEVGTLPRPPVAELHAARRAATTRVTTMNGLRLRIMVF